MGTKTRGADSKARINACPDEILSHYLGAPHDEGARLLWDCRECGKHRKFALNKESGRAGCFNPDCPGHGLKDSIALIAYFEGLHARDDFAALLERGEGILGLDVEHGNQGPAAKSNVAKPRPARSQGAARERSGSRQAPGVGAGSKPAGHSTAATKAEKAADRRALCHRVYSRILDLSPLEDRDARFWRMRGVSYETIERGRFGSVSAERAAYIKDRLSEEFGREALLRVPGFSENPETKKLVFTLTGDYTLIPYHDQSGNITTIEGRAIGEPREGMGKYVSLRGSGNHLYVFPGFEASELEAVTEGSIGAIVAADNGIAVGAIQGCERYRASSSKNAPDGEPGGPLLEMAGVNWGSKVVPYIPDSDDPPNPQVLAAAPKAARHLAQSGGGAAAIARLPNGVDLDEWLLSTNKRERRRAFNQLLSQAFDPGAYETSGADGGEEASSAPERGLGLPDQDGLSGACSGAATKATVATENQGEAAPETAPAKPSSSSKNSKSKTGQNAADNLSITSGRQTIRVPASLAPATRSTRTHDADEGAPADSEGPASPELTDRVYRRLLELCPPLETHLDALDGLGVMREAAAAGNLGSVDRDRCLEAARELGREIPPSQLTSVPGFDRTGSSAIRFSLCGEYLLLPCYDAEGLLRGVEALAYDPDTGTLEAEETVQFSGAGSHLYVFAPYDPRDLEGFCEGILGALLAAQDDVVLGAIGGFRRYKGASGKEAHGQPNDAVLPQLAGVDFGGREIPYVPRPLRSESNARSHEAAPAMRWLVEKQNGVPTLAPLPSLQEPDEYEDHERPEVAGESPGGEAMPGDPEVDSLGKWILALPEDETEIRLREIFPQVSGSSEVPEEEHEGEARAADTYGHLQGAQRRTWRPLSTPAAYVSLAVAAVVAAIVSSAIDAAWRFSFYTSAAPSGEVIAPGGIVGLLQDVTGSMPFEVLHLLRGPLAILVGLFLGLRLARYLTYGRTLRGTQPDANGQDERNGHDEGALWSRHLLPSPAPASRTVVRKGQLVAALLAGAVSFVVLWPVLILAALLYSLPTKVDPGPAGLVFDHPMLVAAAGAMCAALYAISLRNAIARKEAQLLSGCIPD